MYIQYTYTFLPEKYDRLVYVIEGVSGSVILLLEYNGTFLRNS